MPVSQSPTLSSIDLSGLPVEVAEAVAQVVDFCRNQARSDPSAEMFETVETGLREAMNGLGCKLLGAWAESRDDGASRIERDGQSWFRVAATPKTIMTTLGPVVFRRARYRNGASSTSLVPVDESLGLIDDYQSTAGAPIVRKCRLQSVNGFSSARNASASAGCGRRMTRSSLASGPFRPAAWIVSAAASPKLRA